jgi:hypothetical protein
VDAKLDDYAAMRSSQTAVVIRLFRLDRGGDLIRRAACRVG